ncbi:hypothetical protein [Plebeiibacterium sediminum]|uniref:Carboxypeptidase-like regulatory domain-containing protein n=1 Tax=Plebeiibacterium sediminum TaxID=2992112 RepID=A0AAE3SFD1_9BACT|nr:hypothetical protein [Plebeiobacterium sediminum]MCW3787156.1 carboxypeptidase-like regulatory domain-containing protein [Plebeiobacterium sediminum]
MKRYIWVLLFVFFSSAWSNAQVTRDSLLFRGVVMEGDSLFSLPYAKYKVNDDKGFMSNEEGQFSFWAKSGDIVQFSYVGFKPLYVQIHDSLANDNYLMGIFLSRDTIELSEVVILPQNISPEAYARNMPLLSDASETVAQHNVDMSTYQAITQPVTEWDAEMNQKNFLQARSNDVAYRTQIQPNQMVGVSTVSAKQAIERSKLRNLKKPRRSYISLAEWEYLISSYQEKIRKKSFQ